jgi:hypothetical protein
VGPAGYSTARPHRGRGLPHICAGAVFIAFGCHNAQGFAGAVSQVVYSQFLDAVKGGHVRAVRFDDAAKRVYFDLQPQPAPSASPPDVCLLPFNCRFPLHSHLVDSKSLMQPNTLQRTCAAADGLIYMQCSVK